ncbi:MAG: four helix bundle protein [Flaviaesturariibacter sp.]|nr:four helix bundle protein [Flaviaesturariibacter sp.]
MACGQLSELNKLIKFSLYDANFKSMDKISHQSFTELGVWKAARELKKELSNLVKTFPAEERYRLIDQLIRSSRSVTANIAEGHGRFTFKDQLHFCIQARGSLSETHNHLIDEGYITQDQLLHFKLKMMK